MSAYIVNPETVSLILALASDDDVSQALRRVYPYRDGVMGGDARSMLGRYLLSMNVRSVAYRYPADSLESLPGYAYDFLEGMLYRPMPSFEYVRPRLEHAGVGDPMSEGDARRVLGALACFEYQSCELPEFADSPAQWFVDRVRARACLVLASGWEVDAA